MAWFLRAVELPSSDWACRFGPHEYDMHVTIDEAIAHLRLISLSLGPTELYVHHANGRVDALGTAIA